ncbi:MAG: hypothetical protein FJX75_05405 [Armatimonadetes bacterium]|nr:hypothetical protein [Armatimonadota bacterium]
MSRLQAGTVLVSVLVAAASAAANGVWAQETVSAKLDPSGMVRLYRGDVQLAMIELNAHGTDWTHAPQESATAQISDLPDRTGKRFEGTLPIPTAAGAGIRFIESVKALPQSLRLEYDLSMTGALKLNGLQLSVNLPVAQYGGKDLTIAQVEGDPEIVGLPLQQRENNFQIWNGEGAKIEIAKGAEDAITIELRAPTDVVVQDLRQWEHPVFEVRFPAIMEDGGRDVSADDRFHLDLTVSLPVPVKLQGP